ncbi:hypothetical protein [Nonomuraea polychroma]|uniref:hypothetical protein n=1 Tax=Nonomuraea polychroma TaxID=46176 RepID=UPI000FDCF0E6|nr:hypothetical protein [Nonomuraea polychroma]
MIGLAEAALADYMVETDDPRVFLLMVLGAFPASMLLCLWGRLPHGWLISVLGPVSVIACFAAAQIPGMHYEVLGEWGSRLFYMSIGAGAFAFAAALMTPMRLARRLSALAMIAVIGATAWMGRSNVAALFGAQAMAAEGVPLIAPDLPEYRLADVTTGDQTIALWYERRRDRADLLVSIDQRNDWTTPERDCQSSSELRVCREVSAEVWIGTGEARTSMIATRGDALVEVSSGTATEAELLAVLPTFRPVEIWELAWH